MIIPFIHQGEPVVVTSVRCTFMQGNILSAYLFIATVENDLPKCNFAGLFPKQYLSVSATESP